MKDVKIAFGINYQDQGSFQVSPLVEVARALRAEQSGGCLLVGNMKNGEKIMNPFDYSKLTPIFELHNGEDTLLEFVKKYVSKELEKERNGGTNNDNT